MDRWIDRWIDIDGEGPMTNAGVHKDLCIYLNIHLSLFVDLSQASIFPFPLKAHKNYTSVIVTTTGNYGIFVKNLIYAIML